VPRLCPGCPCLASSFAALRKSRLIERQQEWRTPLTTSVCAEKKTGSGSAERDGTGSTRIGTELETTSKIRMYVEVANASTRRQRLEAQTCLDS
jgi:hypothetical protein